VDCQREIERLNLALRFRETQETKTMNGKQKLTFPQTPSVEVPEDKLPDIERLN
jgi:hypothetical protein